MSYGSEKATLLAEVCEATPNAPMAIEKLLGIYEMPFIAGLPHADCDPHYIDKEFVSYDLWRDRITYKAKRNYADDDQAPIWKETTSYCSAKRWNTGEY